MAENAALIEGAVSPALHGATFLRELEPHVRQNVLWVAKQHGHSIITMLRIYAAWTKGAVEADVAAIERSMMLTRIPPRQRPRKPPRSGGRLAANETEASTLDDLAVVQSVPKTITEFFAACESRIRRLTACTAKEKRGWLGWQDSNLRMAGSKPAALPLGDTPTQKNQPERPRVRSSSCTGETFSPRAT